jgi:hypothetical protein
MTSSLLEDARLYPRVFAWRGPVPRSQIDEWCNRSGWSVPEELIEIWEEVGGGDLFESETIFHPISGLPEFINDENVSLREAGMSSNYLAFHRGLVVSVIDGRTYEILTLDNDSFGILQRFRTIDEWYRLTIRNEFAHRYGLRL